MRPPQTAPVLGVMVPKRHANRSVTRSLIKRQMRAAMQSVMDTTSGSAGTWLVRLRQPIDVKRYPSAASEALRATLRAELDGLVAQIVRAPLVMAAGAAARSAAGVRA